jgi:hypothetical protein
VPLLPKAVHPLNFRRVPITGRERRLRHRGPVATCVHGLSGKQRRRPCIDEGLRICIGQVNSRYRATLRLVALGSRRSGPQAVRTDSKSQVKWPSATLLGCQHNSAGHCGHRNFGRSLPVLRVADSTSTYPRIMLAGAGGCAGPLHASLTRRGPASPAGSSGGRRQRAEQQQPKAPWGARDFSAP